MTRLCLLDEELLMIHGTKDPHDVSAQTGRGDAEASGTKGFHPRGVGRLHATSV